MTAAQPGDGVLPAGSPPWQAPTADGPVRGTVTVPGSKSLTARLLVLGALAGGPSVLRAPLRARDTALMAQALRELGIVIADIGDDWSVTPAPLRGPASLDVGNAGTVARFLPPAVALAEGTVTLDGDPRVRERPLGPLLTALRSLGADVDDDGTGGLPITVNGTGGLPGGMVRLDASSSSQFVSGLLLAGPRMRDGLTVVHEGPRIPSGPHLKMTVACLRAAGAVVDDSTPDRWVVEPGPLDGRDVAVEPDLSSALPFLAAAVATGGEVTLTGWPVDTTQPGRLLPGLLEQLGASVSLAGDRLTVRGGDGVQGVDLELADYGEAVPVLTALAILAGGPSRLRGVGHLRGQETDRLRALSEELSLLGADVTETDDGLAVTPAPLRTPDRPLDPRADHRLAMAYAVAGLAVPGVQVSDMATVGKTLPDFPGRWVALTRGTA